MDCWVLANSYDSISTAVGRWLPWAPGGAAPLRSYKWLLNGADTSLSINMSHTCICVAGCFAVSYTPEIKQFKIIKDEEQSHIHSTWTYFPRSLRDSEYLNANVLTFLGC